jgi:S-ribosylhomocysteine lyase LuxS involved in autoinducer biosynthesis
MKGFAFILIKPQNMTDIYDIWKIMVEDMLKGNNALLQVISGRS